MHILLAYWLISNAQLVATPAPMAFADKQACQDALQVITDNWAPATALRVTTHQVIGMCLPDASPEPPPCLPGTWTPPAGFPICTVPAPAAPSGQ